MKQLKQENNKRYVYWSQGLSFSKGSE